ncbi:MULTISPECIES: extracellular solute-binding protein [Microbacterium]|uniref:extracellular solute-binding protein n=1 Tax=Microbacterium TaxID=33882 RepID=UPI000B851DBB|nr:MULTISPECIES: extracellular solute-binding protein [Microbacterium]MBT2495622.1 extracellular solute-binding protein [Microbacterium sp. ISL-59]
MTKKSLQPLSSTTLSRRTLFKAGLIGGAAIAMGTSLTACAPEVSTKGAKTLRMVMPDAYPFEDVLTTTTEPAADGTADRGLWRLLQSWKETHPDVTLEIETVPWDTITQRVILMGQAGTPADLVLVNDLNIPKLAKGGFLAPLDSLPGEWDDYNQNLLRGIASDAGKIYALPWMTDCRHEMYWKEDWAKAGITEPPETWAEFTEAMAALKDAGIADPYSFWAGNTVHTPTQSLFSQTWMLGGDVIDADGRATLKTDEMLEVFEFYNSLMNEQGVSSTGLLSVSKDDEYDDMLLSHKTATMKGGSWVGLKLDDGGLADEIGYFRTPRPTKEAKDATLSGFWAFELPAQKTPDEAKQELAFEFAMHITGSKGQAEYLVDAPGKLPTRPSASASPQAQAQNDAWKFQADYASDAGRGMPAAADAGLLFDQLRIAFQSYLTGTSPANEALASAEKAYNEQVAS